MERSAVTAYDLWASSVFADAPGGTDQSATGTPDGDDLSNEQEWALATDPFVTGIDVYASWATALFADTWRLNGDGLTETSEGWSNDVETVSAKVPLDGTNKFMRVEADPQ